MEVKELRIGNAVMCQCRGEYKPHTIKSIWYNDEEKLYFVELENGFQCNVNGITPIPITEELLTKIGFILPEHKEFFVMCRINGKDNSIRLTRYFNLWNAEIFASHPEVVMLEHTIKGLRFVHELQNAYYLVTGKELEIKL